MNNKQFISNLSATYADVRKLDVKKINLKGENILDIIKNATPTIKHSQDTRETVTENDLWGQYIETKSDGTIIIHDDCVTNPNASNRSAWYTEIAMVDNNKAYTSSGFYANIQTERIKDGTYMFYYCKNLASFTTDLSSLIDGHKMFKHCENLTSFPSDLPNLTKGYSMFAYSKLSSFSSDLSSLTKGEQMFAGCTNLTSFNGDLPNLTNGYDMFYECDNLTTFTSDLPNLTNGEFMFRGTALTSFKINLPSLTSGSSMFSYCENLTSFKINLPSLTSGSSMFSYCENLESFSSELPNLSNGSWMFSYCEKLTTFSSDLSSLTNGRNMFDKCKLDAPSVANIIHFIPQRDAKPTSSWVEGNILIGIGITNTDAAKQAFAEECDCTDWAELNKEFDDKKWAVQWQFNGPASYSLRDPRPSTAVYTKLEEVFMPTEEEITAAKEKGERIEIPHYEYTSQDGSNFYNIHWYHDSNTDNEGYDYFESLEMATLAYSVIPKA